jgi:uncharacterized membrane protein YfcA
MVDIATLFGGGLLAGILGGLLGIGGGVVLMPMLRFIVGLSPAYAAGTCIVAVFFTTLGGTWRHRKLGNIHLRSIYPIMISGAVATVIFSFVFLYLSTRGRWLDLGIGAVFSLISLRMIAEGIFGFSGQADRRTAAEIKDNPWQKIGIGFVAGALPGLLGIGTGVILVPAFTYLLAAPIKLAMASSLACFSINAFISSAFKGWQGFVDLNVAVPICLGTLIGANFGARLNKSFSSRILRFAFGLLFLYVSFKFILLFAG